MEFCSKGLKSDCKYVVDGANLLKRRLEQNLEITECKLFQGSNADLWMNFKEVLARRGYRLVEKVKAHSSIDSVANGEMSIQDFIGNHVADVLAKAAATAAACPRPVTLMLSRNAAISYCVSMRAAYIEADCWVARNNKTTWEVLETSSKLSMQQAAEQINDDIERQGHVLARVGHKFRCVICHLSKTEKQFSFWTENACVGAAQVVKSSSFKAPRAVHSISWNNHQLFRSGQRFACLLCNWAGALGDVPAKCLIPEGKVARTVSAFEGNLSEYKAAKKQADEAEVQVARHDRWISSVAAGEVLKSIPGANPKEEENVIPHWASKTHPSHRVLKYAGGMVMCSACSSISSSSGGNSRLWRPCHGKIAQGSLPRYRKFLSGWHPHFPHDNAHLWPSGAPTSAPLKVYTAKRHVDGSLCSIMHVKTTAMVLPQRGYTYKFVPNTVSFQQQQVINGVLDNCLEEFEKDPEEEIDFKPLLAVLGIKTIDPAARTWLGSPRWEAKIDELLEKSWQFENELSIFLDTEIRKKELQHDALFPGYQRFE